MSDDSQNPEKKLIIDEDWKSQVEAEREAAQHAPETPTSEAEQPSAEGRRGPMPPANLEFLIGTLHLQAAMGLGLLPNPVTKKTNIQLEQAKHSIDLLVVLQEKTEGHRTLEENETLDTVINELRWAYITVSEQLGTKA
jgi:hypothetical protein